MLTTLPWGKLRRDPQTGQISTWHALINHAADVAACAKVLLEESLLSRRLAAAAGLDAFTGAQLEAIVQLAAWHDLGKANQGFQEGRGGHVSPILDLLSDEGPQGDRLYELLPEIYEPLLLAAFAHHGWPQQEGRYEPGLWRVGGGYDPLDEVERIVRASRRWLPEADPTMLPESDPLAHALNGLITLADWVASDEALFPLSEEGDESAADRRFQEGQGRARGVLRKIGLLSGDARPDPKQITFADLSEFAPRPAQEATWGLPTEGPSVVVLEAATGSGKTEAALGRFLRLFAAGEVDGLYFALPTRAAATQIHRRVYEAVQRALGPAAPPVILAIPGYHRADDLEGRALPGFQVRWDRPRDRLRGWASEQSKRFLGASIAVGTIDQALLSGLQIKHAHLRGAPLLRSLLVVDEVHASDTYMTGLLRGVLARHIKVGGHALLLSATLGSERRLELLHAERRIKRAERLDYDAARASHYPLLSYRAGLAFGALAPPSSSSDKVVRFDVRPWMANPVEIARFAAARAEEGARVLIIRNTVGGCLETQEAIERAAPPDLHLQYNGISVCHHARFAAEDRRRLDRAVEAALDPKGAPGGRVVVATQTVEQSLDIDADLLITDLCPMDVLLQRVGRLHRHRRDRPRGFERAQVILLTPEARDLSGLLERRRGASHGLGTVYPDLRVIEATWAALEEAPEASIPRDARALVEAATHSERLEALSARGEAWARHAAQREGQGYAELQTALHHQLDWWGPAFGDQPFPRDKRIGSRLGELARLVRFDPPVEGPLGEPIRSMQIPHHLLGDVEIEEDTPRDVRVEPGRVRFFFGIEFTYVRSGLHRASLGQHEGEIDA